MSDFINKDFQKQTIKGEEYDKKISVSKGDVSLEFLNSNDTGQNFHLRYTVIIKPKGRKLDPKEPLSPKNIKMTTLRDAIIANISSYDQRYMILKEFDERKCKFIFDYEKWLRDATRGMKPVTHFTRFDRHFKFKKQIPKMIRTTISARFFDDFIVRKFLDWLNKTRKEQKFFKRLIPQRVQRQIRMSIRNMFDWSYDMQWNRVVAKMKPKYVVGLLFATGVVAHKLTSKDVKGKRKELFATRVEKKISKFDRKKWEKFIRRRFV